MWHLRAVAVPRPPFFTNDVVKKRPFTMPRGGMNVVPRISVCDEMETWQKITARTELLA